MVKRPKVPFANGRKICIFCGQTPVSEEHVWPQWAHHLLPNTPKHYRKVWEGNKAKGSVELTRGYDRQGSGTTIRIARVCRPCNSGWMSRYEQSVRPFLEKMIVGRAVGLDETAQLLLTEYFTMKMMVVDWETNTPIMSDDHRTRFFNNRTIPPNTQIFLFKCGEVSWRANLVGHAVGLWPEGDTRPGTAYNTKSFAMGLGDLFVVVVFAPDVNGKLQLSFEPGLSVRIHLPANDFLRWPPLDAYCRGSRSLRRLPLEYRRVSHL